MRRVVIFVVFFIFSGFLLFAQTHVSVPVDHSVYYLLDLAEARGLCAPLPAVKPYTRGRVVQAIDEILAAEGGRWGALSNTERKILDDARSEFISIDPGLDLWKGKYRFDMTGEKGVGFSGELGISLESLNSAAYFQEEGKAYLGTDTWGTISFKGDIGENFSFGMDFSAGFMKAERIYLGEYYPYASQYEGNREPNDPVQVYSQPKAFFPYTYQKNWDGFMFSPGNITAGSMEAWPQVLSIAAAMSGELSGSVFGDMLQLGFGRMQREWGGMTPGSSLVLNAGARPFVGIEAVFNPASWFAFSSLTGVLEYYDEGSIKADTFQNAFSIQQVEFNKGNTFHIDFGSTVIWAKRFELGYLFPLIDNFFYQNYIGDFDNMGIFMNMRYRIPGLGGLWFSVFVDEVEVASIKELFNLDRHMFAYQAGFQFLIPSIPFASLIVSYTKVEPYNYTHVRENLPWYGTAYMETAYVNNGVSLGHYLPPNSDEVKVRFQLRPWLRANAYFQYQLIRHGADYGYQQVDGSSLISELDPSGRDASTKTSLKKDFLNDGAYQWMHILKIGAEYKFGNLPLTVFGETGLVYSYFTKIEQDKYAAIYGSSNPANDTDYPNSTSYILSIGFRVFK